VSFDLTSNDALGAAIKAVDNATASLHMPASLQASFQGTAASFTNSLSNQPLLILAALVAVYIVLGFSMRASFTPSPFSRRCFGRRGRAAGPDHLQSGTNVVALIGIILLIGIVTKNGIMMVDFALDASEPRARTRPMRSMKPACCASGPS